MAKAIRVSGENATVTVDELTMEEVLAVVKFAADNVAEIETSPMPFLLKNVTIVLGLLGNSVKYENCNLTELKYSDAKKVWMGFAEVNPDFFGDIMGRLNFLQTMHKNQ